jgi:hypothetical protein
MELRDTRMLLDQVLHRSDELDDAIVQLLGGEHYRPANDTNRVSTSASAAAVSLAHARALRCLIATAQMPSAVALLRLQFETLTRSVWLLYAANDLEVELVAAPLSAESEKEASKLFGIVKMLAALSASSAPSAAAPTAMLNRFKKTSLPALNSFVHGGIHPLQRHRHGYPESLIIQVLECSNGLLTMSGMILAVLTGDQLLAIRMNRVHIGFEDCITPILESY